MADEGLSDLVSVLWLSRGESSSGDLMSQAHGHRRAATVRKPVRGRFFFKIPLDGGGSYTFESDKDKSIDAAAMVKCLRECADYFELCFLSKREPRKTNNKP